MSIEAFDIEIFADGASVEEIKAQQKLGFIDGFTTNPTLMRRAGVTDYEAWAREVLAVESTRPVSFEVLADDLDEMERQARKIASWGENVFVKIPITNTQGHSTAALITRLTGQGVKLNVTAVTTVDQIEILAPCLKRGADSIVSIFAGRIADTGVNPRQHIANARYLLRNNTRILWASTRELWNISQAALAGADIITVPPNLLAKIGYIGKNLGEVSLEMVKQFSDDAIASGLSL